MTTLRKLAQENNMQPYELAALLDLDTYDETAEIPETDLTWMREALAQGQEITDRDDDLAVAARNVADAESARAEAVTLRNETIREHHENGATVADIARRTGLTRPMIYSILAGERRRS